MLVQQYWLWTLPSQLFRLENPGVSSLRAAAVALEVRGRAGLWVGLSLDLQDPKDSCTVPIPIHSNENTSVLPIYDIILYDISCAHVCEFYVLWFLNMGFM